MRALRRIAGAMVALAVAMTIGIVLYGLARARPQDLPWTPLDLGQPVGLFTERKLVGLGDDFGQCQRLLAKAGVHYRALPVRIDGQCGYADAVRFTTGGARRIGFVPTDVGVACPVAAALAIWEWDIVQPAALRRFGKKVERIDHFGSYNCRRIYGRDKGSWSEHAAANAIDIAGFRLADGRRITVAADWTAGGDRAAFLREVRDGACSLFATTLSPDYNAAHRDHLHLDQADRGTLRGGFCR